MRLQHLLEDLSTVKNAFDIKNFVKVETHSDGDIYWFTSMQRFRFDNTSNTYEHTISIYNKEHSYPWEDTYAAFQELQIEIDNNIIGQLNQVTSVNGWAGPSGNGNATNPIYPNSATKELMSTKSVTGPNNTNPLFCSCTEPNLVKSNAGGEVFDYCKDCKKEHKAETKSIGKGSEPDELFFF